MSTTAIDTHAHGDDGHGTHEGHDGHHHHADGSVHPATSGGEARPAGGPVVLDIGGAIGAAIIRLDDELEGTELPILALDDPDWDPTTHTGVWRRPIGSSSVTVAVYPALPFGRYSVTLESGQCTVIEVRGGHVTEADLRTAAFARPG